MATTPVTLGAQGQSPELAAINRTTTTAIESVSAEKLLSFPAEGGDISRMTLALFKEWVVDGLSGGAPSASQGEVTTGTEAAKYVSPATLRGNESTNVDLTVDTEKLINRGALKTVLDALPGGGGDVQTTSNGVIMRHDGGGTPTATNVGNTVTITPNGAKIRTAKFVGTSDGSGQINVTHNQATKTVLLTVVFSDVRINNANYSLALAFASGDPTNKLVITGGQNSVAHDVMLMFG